MFYLARIIISAGIALLVTASIVVNRADDTGNIPAYIGYMYMGGIAAGLIGFIMVLIWNKRPEVNEQPSSITFKANHEIQRQPIANNEMKTTPVNQSQSSSDSSNIAVSGGIAAMMASSSGNSSCSSDSYSDGGSCDSGGF